MMLKINKKCDCSEDCETKDYFYFQIGKLSIRFFNDYGGYKFLYIYWAGMKYKSWQF